MIRDYKTGEANNALVFVGNEIEKTPAFKQKTLFVVGTSINSEDILQDYTDNKCTHIYLGANQSFNPIDDDDWSTWDAYIVFFLSKGILTTIDFDVAYCGSITEYSWVEYNNCIPQISVKIPFASQLGYNAVVKVDDIDFNASNPGVWVHSLHDLQDRSRFTSWDKYRGDTIIRAEK